MVMPISIEPNNTNQPNAVVLPQTGFIRLKQLLNFVPFSSATLWRKVKKNEFPAPIKLSANITAWRAEDVHNWIAQQGGDQLKCA